MKIINNTTLSYETIGLMMDKIIEINQDDTIYYGKIEVCKMRVCNRDVNVQIRYLKKYVEWRFDYKD